VNTKQLLHDPARNLVLHQDGMAPAAPSLKHCDSLAVEGNVVFERGVVLVGNVIVKNSAEQPLSVKTGEYRDVLITPDGVQPISSIFLQVIRQCGM